MSTLEYDHESIKAALGAFGGYGLILVVMAVLLFGLPYAVISLL
jgi:hypothetical protein